MSPHDSSKPRVVVVGNGMVGHHFVKQAIESGLTRQFSIHVIGEEGRLAYDRVNLSKVFSGKSPEDLSLASREEYERAQVSFVLNAAVVGINRDEKTIALSDGSIESYERLILATGSRPFVPEIAGRNALGCFVYRTLDDVAQISSYAANCSSGAVIGGGLLGLEAAGALRSLGVTTNVVEFASRLMPIQVDDVGGATLRQRIEALGVSVLLDRATTEVVCDETGSVTGLRFSDDSTLDCDIVVFSAGIRPRDELGKLAGLELGPRGGIVIDSACRTSDPDIFAIGECALYEGRVYGLVAPGYRMAEVAAATIAGATTAFVGHDMSTKLKLLGVDVGSFGDAFGSTPGSKTVSLLDTANGTYKKLVVDAAHKRLLGGILVGDASAYSDLLTYAQNGIELPEHPEAMLVPATQGPSVGLAAHQLPDAATICSCHNVTKQHIRAAIREHQLVTVSSVKASTRAGTGCGSCATLVEKLLKHELTQSGMQVSNDLCEHFSYSRKELLHLVRVNGIRDFTTLIERHGRGEGCEICKPAVASILASLNNEHILAREHVGLQDTNDRFLANIQKDGTYSVVPRIAAGEITPDQLITIGQIAKRYGLYTKITGGQRIDMFGARVEQLPEIWRELVAAGFESGHAYGKALRTVKSCVGSTWCRYGVQDSVGLALLVEHRYKGLRSPHKVKGAVSGCARECAEAQSKDFGIIATEKGYNLYVCGNGGMKPQHAQLLATDADAQCVIKYLDRFLMFYIRTADRLQRTASWLNDLEGGIDYLRQVVIDDSLGIAAELEAQMARVVDTYQCEWKATLADPEKLKRFRAFVNSDLPDPNIVKVVERGQGRPATWQERTMDTAKRSKYELPVVNI